MKSLPKKVHLPNPCNENWETMLPAEKGRFCLNCQKTVIDFTNKTSEEIIAFIKDNPSGCGRFLQHQVFLSHELPKTFIQKWKEFVAAACLVIGTKLAVLTPAVAQTSLSKNQIQSQAINTIPEPVVASDGKVHLKGVVYHLEDEKPLKNVVVDLEVRLPNHRLVVPVEGSQYKTVTDSAGKFELAIPAVELGEYHFAIRFRSSLYAVQRISLFNLDYNKPIIQHMRVANQEPYYPYYDGEVIRQGAYSGEMPHTFGRKQKEYRTRAGIVLYKATHPFWRLKNKVYETIFYAFHN